MKKHSFLKKNEEKWFKIVWTDLINDSCLTKHANFPKDFEKYNRFLLKERNEKAECAHLYCLFLHIYKVSFNP